MVPGDTETVQDLVVAAHADAQNRLNMAREQIMKEALGPMAGLAGMPGFPGLT
jgi:DNA-binding protein YbaB